MAKTNEQALDEFVFGRKKYASEADKIDAQLKDTLPEYKPDQKDNTLTVTDSKETSKRLQGALGMIVGNTTVKSMADRAVKTFPIIVSDDLSPETDWMIKSLFEEQYANFFDILLSNTMIDLTKFDKNNPDANIALQAIDRVSGTDFSKQRLANAALKGKLTPDEVFKNNSLYQLLRAQQDEGVVYKSGNPLIDSLLEGAIIVKPDQVGQVTSLMEVLQQGGNANGTAAITPTSGGASGTSTASGSGSASTTTSNSQIQHLPNKRNFDEPNKPDQSFYLGSGTKYANDDQGLLNRVLSPSYYKGVKVNNDAEKLGNKTIAEILERPENRFIRDRYEKALYLLDTNRISGNEFISYSIDRCGIPLDLATRQRIIRTYPASTIRMKGGSGNMIGNDSLAKLIGSNTLNRHTSDAVGLYQHITGKKVKEAVALMVGGSVGGLAGAGITAGSMAVAGAAAGSASGLFTSMPWLVPVLAGVGAIAGATVGHFWNKKKNNVSNRIEGWERVESLIDAMDKNYLEVNLKSVQSKDAIAKMQQVYTYLDYDATRNNANAIKNDIANEQDSYSDFKKKLAVVYESVTPDDSHYFVSTLTEMLAEASASKAPVGCYKISEKATQVNHDMIEEAFSQPEVIDKLKELDELFGSKKDQTQTIYISNNAPVDVKRIKTSKLDKDYTIMPFADYPDVKAYGSVEYDKKLIKDRRYNEPLFLTVTFKERFSDDKMSDNDLVAVIGIQGIINRIPSDEMEYILRANAGLTEGDVALKSDSGHSEDAFDQLMANFKNSEYGQHLPTSGKLFNDLSKIASLAVANKLAGKDESNISNTHIVFSQKEIDAVKASDSVDYTKDMKLVSKMMKKYACSVFMVCDDSGEKSYICDDIEKVSLDLVPYSAIRTHSNDSSVTASLNALTRMSMR